MRSNSPALPMRTFQCAGLYTQYLPMLPHLVSRLASIYCSEVCVLTKGEGHNAAWGCSAMQAYQALLSMYTVRLTHSHQVLSPLHTQLLSVYLAKVKTKKVYQQYVPSLTRCCQVPFRGNLTGSLDDLSGKTQNTCLSTPGNAGHASTWTLSGKAVLAVYS